MRRRCRAGCSSVASGRPVLCRVAVVIVCEGVPVCRCTTKNQSSRSPHIAPLTRSLPLDGRSRRGTGRHLEHADRRHVGRALLRWSLEHALLLAKLLIALGIAEVPLWVVKTREYKRWVMERLDEATALGRGASFDAELVAARGRLDAEFENEVGIMEEGLRLQGQFVDDVDNVIDEHLGEPAGRSPASRGGRGEELQFL